MTDIFIKIAAAVALLAVLFSGEQYIEGRGYSRAQAECQAATNKLKADAAAELASLTAKTRSAEQALQDLKNTQELQDATHQKTVADLSSRLRNLAGADGRLRDPHAAGCGDGGSNATGEAATAAGDSANDTTQTGGLLSADLSGLLQRLQLEADTINVAYASCRADAFAVRQAPDIEFRLPGM